MRTQIWIYVTATLVVVLVALFFFLHKSQRSDSTEPYVDLRHQTRLRVVVRRDPANVSIDSRLIAAANNFAFRLMKDKAAQHPGANLLVAPAVLEQSLCMAMNGASGATRQAITTALGVQGIKDDDLNIANTTLLEMLRRPDYNAGILPVYGLWVPLNVKPTTAYIQQVTDLFSAEVHPIDFTSKDARAQLDEWVKNQTVGKVDHLVPAGEPLNANGMLLCSVATMNAAWQDQFSPIDSALMPFTAADGAQAVVPMLRRTGMYDYCANEQFQAVGIPYAQGRLSLYIILPAKGIKLEQFEAALSDKVWESWMSSFEEKRVMLALPRFTLHQNVDISATLRTLGLGKAFTAGQAQFTDLSSIPGLALAQVRHIAHLETCEQGTAAAADFADPVLSPEDPAKKKWTPTIMTIDRPFFLAVRERSSGVLFYIGSVSHVQ